MEIFLYILADPDKKKINGHQKILENSIYILIKENVIRPDKFHSDKFTTPVHLIFS